MSSVIQDGGGFVVISQVEPQNHQQNGPEEGQSSNAPASLPKPIVAFYHGEPEVLGTTQIFSGILLISIGIALTIIDNDAYFFMGTVVICGIPIWSGLLFITSGSLSVAASAKPTVGKVKSSLVMNIVSILAASCGIIIAGIDLGLGFSYISSYLSEPYCAYYNEDTKCIGNFAPLAVPIGTMSFILLLFMLMFCITISTSVFACKTVCRSSFQEMTVIIYQTTSVNVSDTSKDIPLDSSDAFTHR